MRDGGAILTNKAMVALPTILFIGGLIVEISLAGIFVSYYLSQSGFGIKRSSEALAAAQAGIEDALLRIVRNKNFLDNDGYELPVGNTSANIVVCRDSKTVDTLCDTLNNGKSEITSTGTSFLKKRKLRAIVNINSATGEIKVESIEETTI